MLRITALAITLLAALLQAKADGDFTLLEQQQISVETPGLFERSSSFKVDFEQYKADEYSFPLPVGKVAGIRNAEVEIETTQGDAVKAMFAGTVRLSRHNPTYGNVVVIRHENGFETMYAHNAQNLVKVGDRVKSGQTVAIVGGKDGKVYTLFALLINGRRVNPETILSVSEKALRKQSVTVQNKDGKISIRTAHRPEKPRPMSFETNNPFGAKQVYRLDLTAMKPEEWCYPLKNARVISGYGVRRGKRGHSGVDLKNGSGNEIYAAFDGKVVQSGVFSAYGKCITIRHANGLETRYSHNSKNYVKVGDMVKAGQTIGVVGRTGRATTEHLHFETRINGRAFNPAYVFDHGKQTLQKCVLQFKKNGSVTRLKSK